MSIHNSTNHDDDNQPFHTARFYLDKFLSSENFSDYNLVAADIALLNAICYYIDCDKDGKNACCAKRITLANRSGICRDAANKHIKKMMKLNLIQVDRRWKLTWITLAENLIKTLPTSLSRRSGRLDQDVADVLTIEDKIKRRRNRQKAKDLISPVIKEKAESQSDKPSQDTVESTTSNPRAEWEALLKKNKHVKRPP